MDYYQILGVSKHSSPEDIKRAYRKLASVHHPDKGGDTATFQNIQTAYDILIDPQKRQQYDNPQPQFGSMPGGFNFNMDGFDLSDIFSQVFGHPGRHQGHRAHIFRTQVEITLQESYNGSSRILNMRTPQGPKVININIPKGADTGNQIRYDNVLDNNTTLMVEFLLHPDLRFNRKGPDLYYTHQISVLDLIVGSTFSFTSISGKELSVNIPPKTQPSMNLRLNGHGMPIQNSSAYGDQIILLNPYIPDIIDEEITESIMRSKNK